MIYNIKPCRYIGFSKKTWGGVIKNVRREGGVSNGMNQTRTCITVCTTSLTWHIHVHHCTSSAMLVSPEVVIFPKKSVF